MKLVIVIEGESAEELFAVGPKDLKEYFLPKSLKVKSKDVKKCWFEEIGDVGIEDKLKGKTYTVIKHKDNIY